MAEIWTRATRQRQPSGTAPINRESPQARGLALYWPFNSIGLRDASGNGLDGTGSPTQISTPYGVGRRFNGSNDVRVTPNARINSSVAWTSCAFARFASFSNSYNTLIAASGSISQGFRELHIKSNGKLALWVQCAGGNNFYDGTGANTLSTNTWYHLAMTYSNAAGLVGYINASVDGTSASNGALVSLGGAVVATVGNNPPNFSARYINADVFDARVYDRALSQSEIADVYRNPWQLFAPDRRVTYFFPASGIPTLSAATAVSIGSTTATPRVTLTF